MMKIKKTLTKFYDFFEWHGWGQILVGAMCLICLCFGIITSGNYLEKLNLLHQLENRKVDNEIASAVILDDSKHVVMVGDIYYQGVCQLDSIDFDDNGDTCEYKCWWKGEIGGYSYYRLYLPCIGETE